MSKLINKAHAWVAARKGEEHGAAFAEHGLLWSGSRPWWPSRPPASAPRAWRLYDVAF